MHENCVAATVRDLARNVIVEGALDSPLEHQNRNWILTDFLAGALRGGVRQPLRRAPQLVIAASKQHQLRLLGQHHLQFLG